MVRRYSSGVNMTLKVGLVPLETTPMVNLKVRRYICEYQLSCKVLKKGTLMSTVEKVKLSDSPLKILLANWFHVFGII